MTWEFVPEGAWEGAPKEQSEVKEEDPQPHDEVHHRLRETYPEPAELQCVLGQVANIANNRIPFMKALC